jgi:sugar lactone lactonase YvrE
MTLKAPDMDTILEYVAAKPGFITKVVDGRIWVFREGDKQYDKFVEDGELAKHTIRPAVGPLGSTLKAPDAETIDLFLASKPGFVTKIEDGRIWVFKPNSEELKKFERDGELAKHVIRPAAGPAGMTVKAPDNDVLLDYLMSRDGFKTFVVDGRLWIFKDGSDALKDYLEKGELAKHVIRPGAGPGGITLKATDMETIDDYLRVAQQ